MLSPYWPYILVAILLLVLCTAVVLYLVLRRARRRAAPQPVPAPLPLTAAPAPVGFMQHAASSSLGLKVSFALALRALRGHVTGSGYRYRLPWFLLVGEEQSGKTTLLAEASMHPPLGRPGEQLNGDKQGVNWFFFDRGVVLDVSGRMVLRADGGEASNGQGWAALSRQLQKHRPERPVDGVVLTIPCTDLYSAGGFTPEQRARVEQKAANLYRKLWQAQKHLGMSFPVYVVVTKCDRVPGFQSLCRELPATMRDDMFGWSSPYALETAYRPEWVGEAFRHVYGYLSRTQVELFADGCEPEERDDLFLLPSEMQRLRAPLQIYLDQIFKESSFHESFFFRGLYFSGDAGTAQAAPQLMRPGVPAVAWSDEQFEANPDPFPRLAEAPEPEVFAARRPAFVKDLFEEKIFREDTLARPVTKTRLSRNRTVLVAQVLSLAIPIVGCLGLLVTHAGLEKRRDDIYDLLMQEEEDLAEVVRKRDRRKQRDEQPTPPRFSDFFEGSPRPSAYAAPPEPGARAAYRNVSGRAEVYAAADGTLRLGAAPAAADDNTHDNEHHMLSAMAKVEHGRIYSFFIPSSWLSGINQRISHSVVIGFEKIILGGIRDELDERTDLFLDAMPLKGQTPGLYTSAPLLPGAGAEDAPSPLYDQEFMAGDEGTLRGFIERFSELLVNRSRYEDLIRTGSGSLEELGALTVYLGHDPLPDNFDTRGGLYRRTLREAKGPRLTVDRAVLEQAVQAKVAEMVVLLYERSFEERARDVSFGYLNDIAQTEALLARPENKWLAAYRFNGRLPFHDMTLAAGLQELHRALEGLRRESFMEAGGPRVQPLPRRQFVWGAEPLRRAIRLFADYDRFIEERGARAGQIDGSVKRVALERLAANVKELVERAKSYHPVQPQPGESAWLASLAAEIKSLKDSEETLSQLLAAADKLKAEAGIEVGLRPALAAQVAHLNESVNGAFAAERFYTMARPNFNWWEGAKPVAAHAFGVESADDLAGYLAVQRKRISYIARDLAAPVQTFALKHGFEARSLSRSRMDWDWLLAELESYDNKQPGNSLGTLESFILSGMDKVEVDRCAEWDGGAEATASRDFFIQARNHLRTRLRTRCFELAAARVRRAEETARAEDLSSLENYDELADHFNRTLAGRFPFGEGGDQSPYAEADPSAVLAFFQLYDKKAKLAREALHRNPQLGASRASAYEFLERMEEVRGFFAGFLEKKAGPTLDFNLEFRVNREHEAGASQIADWTLDVGRMKYGYRDKELAGRWVFGEPVRLTLRWAGNSPVVPHAAPETPNFRAKDRVAVFEYKNRWSLLTMLMRQRPAAADFAPYAVDQEVYSLRFDIPTQAAGNLFDQQPADLQAQEAKVFMRLSLVAPGGKAPLTLPYFPAGAPPL